MMKADPRMLQGKFAILTAMLICSPDATQKRDYHAMREAFANWKHADVYQRYWSELLKSTNGGLDLCTGKPSHPTEPAITFLSAWACTAQEPYAEAAKTLLEFAHSLENSDGLLVTESGCNRDSQARQIYNFVVACWILEDERYLRWADHCADAMLTHLPRQRHSLRGKQFVLFSAGAFPGRPPYRNPNARPMIDVNQNAEIALAFTLLYFEKRSAFYQRPILAALVRNEMEAGLSLVDEETGAVPLTEQRVGEHDTAYASYALLSWVWMNQHWKHEDWRAAIDRSGSWIERYSRGENGRFADRFYPKRASYLSFWDTWYRIPVLFLRGVDPTTLIDHYVDKEAEMNPVQGRGYLPCVYFDLMGIPPDFYMRPESKLK